MSYDPNEGIRFKATCYDIDNSPADASEIYISIFNPEDKKIVDKDTPQAGDNTGEFIYSWNIPKDAQEGVWTIEWEAVVGSYTTIDRMDFAVSKEEL